jgi:EAL domain-containing protein (putative c-di-GMP-specific phosphodiesterase class I)
LLREKPRRDAGLFFAANEWSGSAANDIERLASAPGGRMGRTVGRRIVRRCRRIFFLLSVVQRRIDLSSRRIATVGRLHSAAAIVTVRWAYPTRCSRAFRQVKTAICASCGTRRKGLLMELQWRRSALLALICAALFWVNIPYQASFFGVSVTASLAHLHGGFLFAVAVLHRQRLPLLACTLAAFCVWVSKNFLGGGDPLSYVLGAGSYVATYAGLRWSARWLVPVERGDWTFMAADMPRFVLVGMLLFPLLLAVINAIPSDWAASGLAAPSELSSATQVLFAKFFGVLILALPMIVLGTHDRHAGYGIWWIDAVPWRLLLIGIALPSIALHLAARGVFDIDATLEMLLDYRLMVAAVLIWAALRLDLRWSMPLLVLSEFLFAAALARHAGASTRLPDIAMLLRIAVECMMSELLVLLLLLYSRERDVASAKHERDSLIEPLTGLPNLAALRKYCAARGLPPLGFLLLDRTEKISAGLGLRAQAALPRWAALLLHDLVDTYYIGTGQLVLVPASTSATSGTSTWDIALKRLHEGEFLWMERHVRVLPYLGVAGEEQQDDNLDARILRASDAAIEARERGELCTQPAGTHGGTEPHAAHRRALQLSTTVLARVRSDEVELHFQPLSPLSERAARGAVSGEILCRLRDDLGRLMLPGEFLHELQADRRMAELDLAVLRHLDQWLRVHHEQLPALGRISINIGSQSLASRAFAQQLLDLLDHFALPPQRLCLEVTETAAITHAQESAALFAAVRERGCHVAIDDFGIGYQSFERLKQIPFDVIKIDGSFVRDIAHSPRDLELVRATVAVARAFNAETVAEWVEDAVTMDVLRTLNVDWAQGFHIARPAPIDDVLLVCVKPTFCTPH